jgi:hypothetical protein
MAQDLYRNSQHPKHLSCRVTVPTNYGVTMTAIPTLTAISATTFSASNLR